MGRKLGFDDDKVIAWEERLWTPYGFEGSENTMIFYGIFDPATETIPDDPEAGRYLTREYRDHWSSEPFRRAEPSVREGA